MKRSALWTRVAASLACLGMLLPQSSFAAGPTAPETKAPMIGDVALGNGGMLYGQVVTANGAPKAGVPVALNFQGTQIAQTVTDQKGRFAVQGLRGGVYTVNSGPTAGVYRLWTTNTAPPVAKEAVWLVSEGDIVRANDDCKPGLLNNPWVWAGVIATAIAVPIAVASGS